MIFQLARGRRFSAEQKRCKKLKVHFPQMSNAFLHSTLSVSWENIFKNIKFPRGNYQPTETGELCSF